MKRLIRAALTKLGNRNPSGGRVHPRETGDDTPAMPSLGGPVKPELELAFMSIGAPRDDWCPRCLKTTLSRSSIYAVASIGPIRVGEFAICEECGRSPYQEEPHGH